MSNVEKLFSCDDMLDDATVNKIFKIAERSYSYNEATDDSNRDCIAKRRRLLGPVADITHPEFLERDNLPEEDFTLSYTFTSKVRRMEDPYTAKVRDISMLVVKEEIFDYSGNPVEL